MTSKCAPLNGVKTHPLTEHAIGVLRDLVNSPVPTHQVNPGVVNRLLRESLVEIRTIPNPRFKKPVQHLVITSVGRERVA